MAEKEMAAASAPAAVVPPADGAPAPVPPKRSPGHRGADVKDTVAEMAARAHEISLEAGSKMAAAMKDVVNAAAGLHGFVIESARDLVQYMVRRGQMTQEEADKLIRAAEEFQPNRKGALPVPPRTLPPALGKPKSPVTFKSTPPVAQAAIVERSEPAKAVSAPAAKPAARPSPASKPTAHKASKSAARKVSKPVKAAAKKPVKPVKASPKKPSKASKPARPVKKAAGKSSAKSSRRK